MGKREKSTKKTSISIYYNVFFVVLVALFFIGALTALQETFQPQPIVVTFFSANGNPIDISQQQALQYAPPGSAVTSQGEVMVVRTECKSACDAFCDVNPGKGCSCGVYSC